jgi:hypothetical protein
MSERCEFCGQRGALDQWIYPVTWRRVGRGRQGAMGPVWGEAEYSPTVGAVCCPQCFKQRFFRSRR